MFRKYCFTSAFCLVLATAFAQNKFTVKGKLTDVAPGSKISLFYEVAGVHLTDSATLRNGGFIFSGNIEGPVKAYIEVRKPDPGTRNFDYDGQQLFLEKGTTKVSGKNARTAIITGGSVQADFNRLNQRLKPLQTRQTAISQKLVTMMNGTDTTGRSELQKQLGPIYNEWSAVLDSFIRTNPDSYVSFDLLLERQSRIDPSTFEPLFEGLSAALKNSPAGKRLAESLRIAKLTDIGKPIIDFTQETIDGKQFTLSALRGKYVLVDFWASWCGPCRAQNPMLLAAYNKYKEKNFEIVAISLDDKKENWLRAVQQDGMPWIHVSDLKGFKNTVAATYAIKAIPRNFLIDPSGIIIGKNIEGEDLEKALEEQLH